MEKVKVTKKVSEAFEVLLNKYGNERLLARGYDFILYAAKRANRGVNRHDHVYNAMEELNKFVSESKESPARVYTKMLLAGVEVELSKEEKALDLISDALAILRKQQETMENFTLNGPMSVRERGLPRSYYERAAAIDILEAIEL